VNVYAPKCGKILWSATDANGQPSDAFGKPSATKGESFAKEAVVTEIANYTTGVGAIEICSKASGCGTPFSNSAITGYAAGAVMDTKGNCYVSAENSSIQFVGVYFKKCTGTGTLMTGALNAHYGGVFIDTKGNLGILDYGAGSTSYLYVYKGCNPACKHVSTTTLHGGSFDCGLDSKGTTLACGDYINTEVDVYTYSPTKAGAKYSYSFNGGVSSGSNLEDAAFAPSNTTL
jgi:hypothetical protein